MRTDNPHPNGTPALTRWQHMTCKHETLEAVYTHIDQEAGDYQVYLSYYICRHCGRKRYNPYRHRNRIHPLAILIPVGLACLLIAYLWLSSIN